MRDSVSWRSGLDLGRVFARPAFLQQIREAYTKRDCDQKKTGHESKPAAIVGGIFLLQARWRVRRLRSYLRRVNRSFLVPSGRGIHIGCGIPMRALLVFPQIAISKATSQTTSKGGG